MRLSLYEPVMLGVVALLILAASVGCARVGWATELDATRTTDIDFEYLDSEKPVQVMLKFGAAELRADPSGHKLLDGTIEYNVAKLTPEVTSGKSWVEIKQIADNIGFAGVSNFRNEWDLHFGTEQPIHLKIDAGAYDGDWDLGGIPIREMVVNQGASSSTFDFSAPNPEVMNDLVFRTGAADLELLNLANAGFKEMRFEGGASSYTLDFGGTMMRDGFVSVKTGVANVEIIIPSDLPAKVTIRGLTTVNADRDFVRNGSAYVTSAWKKATGPRLEIEIDAGLANIDLELGPAERAGV